MILKHILLLLLAVGSLCYLELPLKRIPEGHSLTKSEKIICQPGQEEICFQKDIAYCVELLHNE